MVYVFNNKSVLKINKKMCVYDRERKEEQGKRKSEGRDRRVTRGGKVKRVRLLEEWELECEKERGAASLKDIKAFTFGRDLD